MPLTDHLEVLAKELRAAKQILLFSDFDGTLVPIMDRPSDCYLDPAARELLSTLARHDRIAGIVSGRELLDLRNRVGIEGIAYAGNHGLEMAGPGFQFKVPEAERFAPHIDSLSTLLRKVLADFPGAWVENKGLTASVHYRLMDPPAIPALFETVSQLLVPHLQAHLFECRQGKKVIEIRPAVDWNKATAVGWLARRKSLASEEPLLIFIGDDETDDDVFRAWPHAMTVSVGDQHTSAARYYVPDHHAVHAFLHWIQEVTM